MTTRDPSGAARRRSIHALAVVAVLAVPLAAASLAFACARLATLKLDRKTASAGTVVDAVGRNFNNDARSSAVKIRFNSRNGPVLWEGRADRNGRFEATFKAPKARPGHYVVLATQQTGEGRPAAGTPGRAPLRMKGAARKSAKKRAASSVVPAAVPVGGAKGGSSGPPGGPAVVVPLALLMLGAGGALVARRRLAPPTSQAS